jgi:hypothetical protein
MMKVFLSICRVMILLICIRSDLLFAVASTSDKSAFDIAFKYGGILGLLGSKDANDGKMNPLGGIAGSGMFLFDYSRWITNFVEPQLVLDLVSFSVLRKGGGAGIMIHLLGGPRKVVTSLPLGTMLSRTQYNVSLIGRIGYYAYTARDKNEQSEPVTGSTAEIFVGLNGGWNVTEFSSLGFEFGLTPFSAPTSIENVKSASTELMGYLRLTM